MKKNRIGFCSYGKIAKTHHIALEVMKNDKLPGGNIEVKALLTRQKKDEHEACFQKIYTDLQEFVLDQEIDIVDICSANYQHYLQAMVAMKNNKSIYLEKPTGMNLDESKELYEYAVAQQIPNAVALVMRFNLNLIAGRDICRSGLLGEIINFKGQMYHWSYNSMEKLLTWRQQFALSGGGAIVDLGIHTIDYIRFCLGEVDSVTSAERTIYKERYLDESHTEMGLVTNDEYAAVLLKMKNGSLGIMESSRVSQRIIKEPNLQIYGTKGVLLIYDDSLEWFDTIEQRYKTIEDISLSDFYYYVKDELLPKADISAFEGRHYASLKNLILIHQGEKNYRETPDLHEAYLDFKVIHAIMKSWKSQQWEKV